MEKSASIKEIGKALITFQTKMDKIGKTATNPFFKSKYAPLPEILEAIQIPLAECSLVFSQLPDGDSLTTIIIHTESGEFLQSSYAMHPVKSDPQGIGSAITYARRYALCSILGLNVDEDDDGNKASQPETKQTPSNNDNKKWLNEGTPEFVAAKKFINDGGKVEKIREKYKVSKKTEEALLLV